MKFLGFIVACVAFVANAQSQEIEFLPSSNQEVLHILADKDVQPVKFQPLDSINDHKIYDKIRGHYEAELKEAEENKSAFLLTVASVKLNTNSTTDRYYIVGLQSTFHCGNYGCACEILRFSNKHIMVLPSSGLWCETNNEETNVYLLNSFTNGLHDIAFQNTTSGLMQTLSWNGAAYIDSGFSKLLSGGRKDD